MYHTGETLSYTTTIQRIAALNHQLRKPEHKLTAAERKQLTLEREQLHYTLQHR